MALKYTKTLGSATTHGQDFEVTLAALLFLRGLNSDLDFQLATNVAGAGAMDDVIFRFKRGQEPDTCWTSLFVQLKHKEKSGVNKQMLTKPKGDFSLPKYFDSYLKIKDAMLKEARETLFNGCFEKCEFVIFTNARAKKSMGEGRSENFSRAEEFLWTDSGNIFSFEGDEDVLKCLVESGDEGGDFLRRLRVFCDQPRVITLKAAVRKELANMTINGEIQRLCDAFLYQMKVWWEKSGYILHQGHNLLQQAVEQIKLESSCQKTLAELRLDVDFEEAALSSLRQTLGNNSKVVAFQCDESSFRLNLTKLLQAIEGQAMVLDSEGLLANKNALLAQWGSGDYSSLLICAKGWSLGDAEKYCEVFKEVCGIRDASSVWNIVFLTSDSRMVKDISGILPICKSITVEKFLFSQLSKSSQESILVKEIQFQGFNLNLRQILSNTKGIIDENLDEYLNASSVVEVLESKGRSSVGPALSQGIDFYVGRSLERCTVVKASVFQEDALLETVTIRVMHCDASANLGRDKLKIGESFKDPHNIKKNALFEKAINYLSSLKEVQSMHLTEEEIIKKLTESPLVPDKDDVFIGPKFLLGLLECNSIGLRFGQDSTVSALRVRTGKLVSRQACFLFVSDKTNEKDVRKLSDFLQSKHLLSLEDGQLRWVQSHGNIDSIRPHIDEDQVTRFAPEMAMDVEDRLVLVCAEPGMGKSTLMARLENNTKEAYPHYFVILIALNDHSQLFAQGKHVDALDFLSSANKIESHLQKSLLKHALEVSGNVVILFDGYDEIAPTYVEQSCQLLSSILDGTKARKIWMTSRNSIKHILENNIYTFSVKLQKFDENDQRCFLKKLWKEKSILSEAELSKFIDQLLQRSSQAVREVTVSEFNIVLPISNRIKRTLNECELSTLHELTAFMYELKPTHGLKTFKRNVAASDLNENQQELIQKISQATRDEQKNFLGIPLQSKMLAEVYEDYVTGSAEKSSLPDNNLDLLMLLEKFVEKKCSIFVQAKLKVPSHDTNYKERYSSIEKQFIGRHLKAGLLLILGHDDIKYLGMERMISELSDFFQKIQSGEDKTGFIDCILNGMPRFVHRVFAEYFVAKWTSEHFSDNQKLITSKMFTDNFAVVRNIMDRILCRGCDLPTAVLDEDLGRVKTLLEREDIDFEAKDGGGRTALHLAASLGTSEDLEENKRRGKILDLLIGKTSDFDQADSVLGGSPLKYADVTQSWIAIDKLLLHTDNKKQFELTLANVTNNRMLDTIFNLDLVNLLDFCFDNGLDVEHCSEGKSRLFLRACGKGSLRVVSLLIGRNANVKKINTVKEDKSPLQSASRHGNVVNGSLTKNLDFRNFINLGDNNGMTALHYAALGGHSDVISVLISQGGDLKGLAFYNRTPLHMAAQLRHAGAVRVLLAALDKEYRADAINLCDTGGKSVLHYGTYGGCVECVELLVQAGGKFTQVNDVGSTPLMTASQEGHQEVVRNLLNNFNAEREGMSKLEFIGMRDKNGFTALHHTATKGYSDVISLLISEGGDPQSHTNANSTPLHLAALYKHAGAVKVLLEALNEEDRAAAINQCTEDGKSVLFNAAFGGCVETVALLVQAGGKLTQEVDAGFTPLLAASQEGHQEVVEYLLNNFNAEREGMSKLEFIRRRDKDGLTAIYYAATRGNSDVISLLISQGGDPRSHGHDHRTPLHMAAQVKHAGAVRVLLEALNEEDRVAAVNACDEDGKSVLYNGAYGGCVDCVALLVQAGGKLTQEVDAGFTPLLAASQEGHQEVVEYLLNNFNAEREGMSKLDYIKRAEKGGSAAIHLAATKGHSDIISFLISEGADSRSRTCNGVTPLHLAAFNKQPAAVRFLLDALDEDKLADAVNSCDNDSKTVLHYGVSGGCVQCVELLVQAGVKLTRATVTGYTPLIAAAEKGDHEIVCHLLNNFNAEKEIISKIDYINLGDQNGYTAIHMCASNGHATVISYLVSQGGDPLSRAVHNSTPLHVAATYKQPGAMRALLKAMGMWRNRAAAVNSCELDENSALHCGALGGCVKCVELLVQAGGNLTQVNSLQRTPLMSAAAKNNLPVVRYLLDAFNVEIHLSTLTYINMKDRFGKSALDLADAECRKVIKNALEICEMWLFNRR